MHYGYVLLVAEVYEKKIGINRILSLYPSLHNLWTPYMGSNSTIWPNQNSFLNQCVSYHIFEGVLYEICEPDYIGLS